MTAAGTEGHTEERVDFPIPLDCLQDTIGKRRFLDAVSSSVNNIDLIGFCILPQKIAVVFQADENVLTADGGIKEAGVTVRACSHITGGGFYENIPRMLPEGKHAVVRKDSYEVPAIFKKLQKDGDITEEMMYNTYNMGIGMIVAVDKADVDKTMEAIKAAGETAYIVGEVTDGEKGVTVC